MDVEIFADGDRNIWLPVSQKTQTQPARVFLPTRGLNGKYTHGFKSAPQKNSYLKAVSAIQKAYINNEEREFIVNNGKKKENQRADKWRQNGSLLGPTLGWIKVPISELENIDSQNLVNTLENSGTSKAVYKPVSNVIEPRLCDSQEELDKEVERLYPVKVGRPEGQISPKRKDGKNSYYVRDATVVAYVLTRSNGVCEACSEPAPFKKQNGLPFLEVHHLRQLSDKGSDKVTNAIAVCPNCHREFHFGEHKQSKLEGMYNKVRELRKEF